MEILEPKDLISILPPELDLLEILSGQDETLASALLVFQSADDERALERARHVVSIYARSGLVQLVDVHGGNERVLKEYEIRSVLSEDESWIRGMGNEHYYLLRLTDRRYQAFAEDSQRFFEQLFDRG